MAGRRQAPPSHTRLLRALAAGSSLSFSILLLWLAPAGATPSHSRTPKPGSGHSTPVTTPVPASTPAVASVPAAGVAAPAVSGAATVGAHPSKHAAKHSAGGG